MQKTSELYKKLIDARGHVKEAEIIVAGEEYGSGSIVSMETDGGLFEQETVSVGGCVSRQLDVVLYGAGDIPKGAKLIPRYRVRLGDQVSEWVQKGTFYIDTREPDKEMGTVSIHAFDGFLRMETEWIPEQDLEFPMPMDQAAKAVAQHYGVEIDPRSRLRSDYYIDYPAEGTTGRQVLQWIAAAHGGNWTMTDAGLARLIRLRDLDSESGLLVTQRGRVIVLNGYAIRVDKDIPGESYDGPSDKVYVGAYAASVVDPPALEPITKIVVLVDDDAYYEAGDDSGQTLELTCPYGTQKMADDLLQELKGYRYKPVSATDALIDPAAELGDGVTVNGIYTVLAQMATTFDLLMASDIGAPGQREIESEIGRYVGSVTKQFDRKIARTRSLITKTAEQVRAEVTKEVDDLSSFIDIQLEIIDEQVNGLDGRLGEIEVTAESVTQRVNGLDGAYAQIRTEVETVTSKVNGLDGQFSLLEQTVKGFSFLGPDGRVMINNGNLDLTGAITFSDLNSDVQTRVNNKGISSEDATNIAHTTIKNDLMESPTIRGAEVEGGQFWNIGRTHYLEMGELDEDIPLMFRLYEDGTGYHNLPYFSVGLSHEGITYGADYVWFNIYGSSVMTWEHNPAEGEPNYMTTGILWNKWKFAGPNASIDFSNTKVTGLKASSISGLANPADYVTDQGTSGSWTYRKWSSGIAECWRTETAYNVAVTNQWGNVYTSNEATFGSASYPFSFTSAPTVQISPENTNGDWWVATKSAGSSSRSPAYQVCRGTQNSSMPCTAHFYVVGRWK